MKEEGGKNKTISINFSILNLKTSPFFFFLLDSAGHLHSVSQLKEKKKKKQSDCTHTSEPIKHQPASSRVILCLIFRAVSLLPELEIFSPYVVVVGATTGAYAGNLWPDAISSISILWAVAGHCGEGSTSEMRCIFYARKQSDLKHMPY